MKINIEAKAERKAVAVVGQANFGLFFPFDNGKSYVFIDHEGKAYVRDEMCFQSLVNRAQRDDRTVLYEGDEISITF